MMELWTEILEGFLAANACVIEQAPSDEVCEATKDHGKDHGKGDQANDSPGRTAPIVTIYEIEDAVSPAAVPRPFHHVSLQGMAA